MKRDELLIRENRERQKQLLGFEPVVVFTPQACWPELFEPKLTQENVDALNKIIDAINRKPWQIVMPDIGI